MEKTMTRGAIGSGITKDKLRATISRLETERAEMVKARRTPYEIRRKGQMIFLLNERLARLEGKA